MSGPRRAGWVVVVATLLALAAPAHAWTLDYAAPAGCDDAASFRARAEAQRASHADVESVQVSVRASRDDAGRWRVQVSIREGAGAPGLRELDGTSCAEVTGAAALIVAFSLDGALERQPPATPPPVVVVRPPSRPLPPVPDPEPRVRRRGTTVPVWMTLALAGGVDAGTLPDVAPGGRAELAIGWRRASLVLGVARWARVHAYADDGEGLSASAWQGHVDGRVRLWRGLELGGGLEIGKLFAEAVGVDTVIPRTIGWQGVGGSLSWHAPLWAQLEYALEIEVLWPLVRPDFVVDGENRFTPGPCLRGWIGVVWRFF